MADYLTPSKAPQDARGLSRGTFIKGVGAVCAFLAVDCGGILRTAAAATLLDATSTLRRSTFAGHLDETFKVQPSSGRQVAIRLTEVQDLPATALMSQGEVTPEYKEACFLIEFSGPGDQPLPQGTYRVEHGKIGRFDLFVVPTGATDGQAQHYEAVFNRLSA
jgi:hypothetical protein